MHTEDGYSPCMYLCIYRCTRMYVIKRITSNTGQDMSFDSPPRYFISPSFGREAGPKQFKRPKLQPARERRVAWPSIWDPLPTKNLQLPATPCTPPAHGARPHPKDPHLSPKIELKSKTFPRLHLLTHSYLPYSFTNCLHTPERKAFILPSPSSSPSFNHSAVSSLTYMTKSPTGYLTPHTVALSFPLLVV